MKLSKLNGCKEDKNVYFDMENKKWAVWVECRSLYHCNSKDDALKSAETERLMIEEMGFKIKDHRRKELTPSVLYIMEE